MHTWHRSGSFFGTLISYPSDTEKTADTDPYQDHVRAHLPESSDSDLYIGV